MVHAEALAGIAPARLGFFVLEAVPA